MLGRFERTSGVRALPPVARREGSALPGGPDGGARMSPRSARLRLSPTWQARLAALPGALTLLSLLAVLLGTHPPTHDPGPRPTAGAAAPALPELRPAPLPPAPAPLLASAPPDAPRPVRAQQTFVALAQRWAAPLRKADLLTLGRQQTDGR